LAQSLFAADDADDADDADRKGSAERAMRK